MTEAESFLLDANVFIEAARRYYAFDIAPRFWQSLVQHSQTGRVFSIDRVKVELEKGKDELKDWVRTDFSNAFLSTNEDETIERYREVIVWAQSQQRYMPAAKGEFASSADGWLVASAYARTATVVTHETRDDAIQRRIKIPNVCRVFDIRCIDTFALMRRLRIRFD